MQSPDALRDLFRANGRKITAQRQCIFRALEGDVTHPSAERVHEKVRDEMPNVSLKTVYQTLNDLSELGAISMLDVTCWQMMSRKGMSSAVTWGST